MTDIEVAQAIEAETNTFTWAQADAELRQLVIRNFIHQLTEEPAEAAKKVVRVRKPRKQKTVPLTQHAAGQEGE